MAAAEGGCGQVAICIEALGKFVWTIPDYSGPAIGKADEAAPKPRVFNGAGESLPIQARSSSSSAAASPLIAPAWQTA